MLMRIFQMEAQLIQLAGIKLTTINNQFLTGYY